MGVQSFPAPTRAHPCWSLHHFVFPVLQMLLIKEEFHRVFEVSVDEFTKLPGWHRTQLLKKTRLFVGGPHGLHK